MKSITHWSAAGAALLLSLQLNLTAADADGVDPGLLKLPPPAGGQQYVEVNIRQNLIGLVARAAEAQEPEIARMLREIRGIRVSVVGLDDSNRGEINEQFSRLRTSLTSAEWDAVATVRDGSENVHVFVKTRGEEAIEGVVVQVQDDHGEAILVSVTGNLRPEQIGMLGERFDIEPLKKIGRKIERP
ncbi:MAG: DUF4252 domain-containing protein [Verrucomicrobiales bacterium]|nr:DUF4252 domain-containing protein [Verrucomicrobiales bacterium]MCP5528312.1 DUF4252 domain-containing protein [Verrucomicrobiales bacterium]